jgi:ornithine cyclodeaminase/alanine dehydrogenase-like protein (mu-crystallin family)
LTIILSEKDVQGLLDMKEAVEAVEEAFRRKGAGEVDNSMRTRSRGRSSALSVMHANLPYLGRGGLKAYMISKQGARFVVVIFDSADSTPLAVMGADNLGRFRTGAASAVATKHLYRKSSGVVAIFGSGKQSLSQVLALDAVMSVEQVRVWSPNPAHRESFARLLEGKGFKARAFESPNVALTGVQVVSAITSSREPFLTEEMLSPVSHVNICGGNVPEHAEMTAGAVGSFDTVVVDDVPQAKTEYGDLIQAAGAGKLNWDDAVELGAVVAKKQMPKGRTLFKSGGVALEDVAVASTLYDKARSDSRYREVELA